MGMVTATEQFATRQATRFFERRKVTATQSAYFDMWRGGSALAVALGHTFQIFSASFPAFSTKFFSALAGAAVMAFFALSGFFIHKSISQCWGPTVQWRTYAVARINRIMPAFILCLALTAGLHYAAPYFFISGTTLFQTPIERTGYSLEGFWRTAFFLNNFLGPALSANGPLWSLTFEVWYYALAMLITLAVAGKKACWIALPIVVVLTILDKFFLILGIIWLGGFLLSSLHSQGKLPRLGPAYFFSPIPLLLLTLASLGNPHIAGKAALGFELSFGVWMLWHMNNIIRTAPPFIFRPLAATGSFSYSLYVFHFPILLFSYGVSEATPWIGFSLAVGISALAGGYIEKFRPLARPIGKS